MKISAEIRNLPSKLLAADNATLVGERVKQGTHLFTSWRDVGLKNLETIQGIQGVRTYPCSLPLKGNFVLCGIVPGLGCNHSPSQLVHPDVDTLVDSLLVALSSRHE